MLSDADIKSVLRRQEALYRHHPKCQCGSDQVQIMSKAIPARWRCRRCKTMFTSEPGDLVGSPKP